MAYYFISTVETNPDTSRRVQERSPQTKPTPPLESILEGLCFAPNPPKPTYELLANQSNLLETNKSAQKLLRLAQSILHESEQYVITYQPDFPLEFHSPNYPQALATVLETLLLPIKIATLNDIREYTKTLSTKEQNTLLPCSIYAASYPGDKNPHPQVPIAEVYNQKDIQLVHKAPPECGPFNILLKRIQ